jgi:hypothetical protein
VASPGGTTLDTNGPVMSGKLSLGDFRIVRRQAQG